MRTRLMLALLLVAFVGVTAAGPANSNTSAIAPAPSGKAAVKEVYLPPEPAADGNETEPPTDVYVIIGTGTSSHGYPLYRYWNYSTWEGLFLQSEINMAGNITAFAFQRASGTNVDPIQNVTIYMKETTATTLPSGNYSLDGYTMVYSGSFPNGAGTGWREVTLNPAFNYSNTKNLMILVIKGYQAWTSSYPMWYYTTTTSARCRYYYDDYSQPVYLYSSNDRANIRLDISPTVTNDMQVAGYVGMMPVYPSGVPALIRPIAQNNGTATQSAGKYVKMQITGPAYSFRDSALTTRSLAQGQRETLSFNWTPPSARGRFTIKAWTALVGDQVPANDTSTATVDVWNGLYEPFTNTQFPPPGWTKWENDPARPWVRDANVFNSAPACAMYDCWNYPSGAAGWLRSPRLDLTQATNDSLIFYWQHPGYAGYDPLDIQVSTDGGSNWITLATLTAAQNTFLRLAYNLENLTQTNNTYIRFYCTSTYGTYQRIDDVMAPPITVFPNDIGVTKIVAPAAYFTPGTPIAPACTIKNFGSNPQSDFPVTCWIDSSGVRIYNYTHTYSGTLAPGATAPVTFSPNWIPGNATSYQVTMFTDLSNDQDRANDTMKLTTQNENFFWRPFTPNPNNTDRIVHATVYDPVNDKFYMIGGNPAGASGTYVTSCDRYDPATDAWTTRAPKPTASGWHPGSYCRGKIYVIGGHNNSGVAIANNEIYDIATNTWSTGAPRPVALLAHGQVTWRDSLIYCIGGWDGVASSGSTRVDIYDPFSNTWLMGTALPLGFDMGGVAIVGDTIYIVNGVNRVASACWTNLYKGAINPANPTSINWIQGPSHGSNATAITGATALDGKVYWFGGFVGLSSGSNAGWVYDPATGAISSFTPPYRGTIARHQWIAARTLPGPNSGLYGFAGDSACNWSAPNRGYYKLRISTAHDVGCTRVIEPVGSYYSGTNVVPACSVYNYGSATETYNVKMTIATPTPWTATATVTNHAPGTAVYVTFPSWTADPVGGPYAVTCSTELASDINTSNDKATDEVTVLELPVHDVGCTEILAPAGSYESGTNVVPACSVYNYGNQTEASYYVRMTIHTPTPTVLQAMVTDHTPGTKVYVTFPEWTADPPGGPYAVTCSTELDGDMEPGNDKATGEVTVTAPPVYDVGCTKILAPAGSYESGTNVVPACSVYNYGNQTVASYNVKMTIRTPTPTILNATVTGHTPGTKLYVTFPSWTANPVGGPYAVTCSTEFAGDMNRGNDKATGSVTVTAPPVSDTGWIAQPSIPAGPKNKNVKDGGCLTYCARNDTDYVYVLKGNGRYEFYRFNTNDNTWATLESIPAIGQSGKKKAPKKGAAMAECHQTGKIYVVKGNSTLEFWEYDPVTNKWTEKTAVPQGGKAIKEGCGMVSVQIGDTNYIYLLKGSGTQEYYRYNTASDKWETMEPAPLGTSGKTYKNGSCLTTGIPTEPDTTIWALKGSLNEFYAYSVAGNTWTTKAPLPLIGNSGKKKKVKDGAGIAYHNKTVYALKGGNTNEFWSYSCDSDKWTQLGDMPEGGGKKVKGGGALVYAASRHALYALKGNNTSEFYKYGLSCIPIAGPVAANNIATGSANGVAEFALRIAPNPFTGTATISYSLPVAGNVSLKLYDVTGKLVTTLTSGYHNAGSHIAQVRGDKLASGIYLLKLETENTTTTAKLIIE